MSPARLIHATAGLTTPAGAPLTLTLTLKAGESAYIPGKHVHNAWNASATAQARVMVFLVGEKGQPLAIAVK